MKEITRQKMEKLGSLPRALGLVGQKEGLGRKAYELLNMASPSDELRFLNQFIQENFNELKNIFLKTEHEDWSVIQWKKFFMEA